jgi:hypothetical protein
MEAYAKILKFCAIVVLIGGILGGLVFAVIASVEYVTEFYATGFQMSARFRLGAFLLIYLPIVIGSLAFFSFVQLFVAIAEKAGVIDMSKDISEKMPENSKKCASCDKVMHESIKICPDCGAKEFIS